MSTVEQYQEDEIAALQDKVTEQNQLIQQQEIAGGDSIYGGQEGNVNLIQYQLDIKQELEDIEHLLRGQTIRTDKLGNNKWVDPKDKADLLFNERGVQEILKILRMYLNKNILLSNYDEPTINIRVQQFSERLMRNIFMNYDEYGMDTEYKTRQFEMIVMNITDMVEAAYFRALGGQERESLRKSMNVLQHENPGQQSHYPQPQVPKKSLLNPMTWGN